MKGVKTESLAFTPPKTSEKEREKTKKENKCTHPDHMESSLFILSAYFQQEEKHYVISTIWIVEKHSNCKRH